MINLVPKPTPSLVLKPFSQKYQALNSLRKLIYLMLIGKFHLMKNRKMCVQLIQPEAYFESPGYNKDWKMQRDFPASYRRSAQRTGWLRRISRRYLVVRCNRGRIPEKIQCGQSTAGSKELHREWRQVRIILDNVILFGQWNFIARSKAGTEARSKTSSTAATEGCQRSWSFSRTYQLLWANDSKLCSQDAVYQWTPAKR